MPTSWRGNLEGLTEMAKDVVSFLTQAAEPEMEERKLDEKDVFQSLDLLYRRVEIDILKREAIPAMRLLNDLLNMHDGGLDNEGWPKGNEGSYNEGDASTIVIVDQYVKNLCSGDWPTNGTNFGVLAH